MKRRTETIYRYLLLRPESYTEFHACNSGLLV